MSMLLNDTKRSKTIITYVLCSLDMETFQLYSHNKKCMLFKDANPAVQPSYNITDSAVVLIHDRKRWFCYFLCRLSSTGNEVIAIYFVYATVPGTTTHSVVPAMH